MNRVKHAQRRLTDAIAALDKGAVISRPRHIEWEASGDCQRPVFVETEYRNFTPKFHAGGWREDTKFAGVTTMHVRCRKCPNCLRKRAAKWRIAMTRETKIWSRTWFGTLTIAPEHRFLAKLAVDKDLQASSERFEDLDDNGRFSALHAVYSREITKFLKRVRRNSQAELRYCLVAERHKSGEPHYHLLVHECSGTVLHKHLSAAWKIGFSSFKLADVRAASYVAKYIAKSAAARVRASAKYGSTEPSALQAIVTEG